MTRAPLSSKLRDDDGLGLVLVLAMGGILTGLMILTTTAAIRSLASSRQHVSFESALAVADGGVDVGLARTRAALLAGGTDSYVVPSLTNPNETCKASPVAWPFSSPPTAEQERAWARSQLETLAGVAGCLQTTKSGQYVILKPSGRQAVYAMGWSPRRGAPELKRRLIKAEYLFAPYSPSHAILTGGDLNLGSSTKVTTAPPNDPALASVHSNGQISVATGNPTVTGTVTQSAGTFSGSSNNFALNPGGTATGAAAQPLPFRGSRTIWNTSRTSNPPGGWYDLCPDGSVRSPTGAAPCTGSLITEVSGSGSFRGWSFNSGTVPTWSAGDGVKTGGNSGTYYIHHGNVINPASNAGPRVPNLTVLASSTALTCNKVGGNITWGSTDPAAPSVANTWLVADQDLMTTSNYQAGSAVGGTVISGFFIAGDQVDMSTSSNGAYGAVLAADQCSPAGSLVDKNDVKNPSIFFDPNAQAPFADVINNTLWLEYPN